MLGKKRYAAPAAKKASKFRKKYKKQAIERPLSNNRVHLIRRHVDGYSIPLVGAASTAQGFNFSLNDVPGASDFTNLYDQYKICAVHMKFYPSQTQSTTLNPAERANANARFLSCIDYTDAVAPTTADEVRQYESCEVTPILEPHERFIKHPLYQNNSGQNVGDWVGTSSSSLNWFGLRIFIEPCNATGTNSTLTYHLEMIYYLCFKNVK